MAGDKTSKKNDTVAVNAASAQPKLINPASVKCKEKRKTLYKSYKKEKKEEKKKRKEENKKLVEEGV